MDYEYIAEWFQFADMDMKTAEYIQGMRPQPLEIICYHCQQSAEKNLKGYLIFNGTIELPKTHDLTNLNDMCQDIDKRFIEIERACDVLTRYGVQPRYPREIGVTVNDALKALEYARQVRDFEPLAKVRRETSGHDSDAG
jgi:HEPN domain-containing protein